MAKVAGPGALPQDSLRPGGGGGGGRGGGGGGGPLKVGARGRRKTPSELRGEQLKRENVAEILHESPVPLPGTMNDNSAIDSLKKSGGFKPTRYMDTRVDEVYPAKKSRFKMISVKENVKESHSVEQTNALRNISALSSFAAQKKQQLPGQETSAIPPETSGNDGTQTHRMIEACSQSRFRSVAEISSSGEKLSTRAEIDMDKALKGLAAFERSSPGLAVDSFETSRGPPTGDFCPQGITFCKKTPIDLTLKTTIRVVSSSPLNWIYRSVMNKGYESVSTCINSCSEDQIFSSSLGTASSLSDFHTKALHSWIYPQSTLPPSLISVLISSSAEKVELDFLKKRELGWEESFRNLYYKLRKRACRLFYVCTSQFVVMFTGIDESGKTKHTCNAYISRSTRGLRALLRVHDVCFSMTLCLSKVEQVATEDLVELSEIEKHNLGKAPRPSSLTNNIDNSPQSLLAITGNKNVHGLYDFLLNHRSSMTFLTGEDVPVLYSPLPFHNGALSIPEVRCIEMKRADHVADSSKWPTEQGADPTPPGNILEIKDAYLPPWILCNLCELISSHGSFEASFITEGTSTGLNVALEALHAESSSGDPKEVPAFGIPGVVASPLLRSGSLKTLRFCDGSYTASISPA